MQHTTIVEHTVESLKQLCEQAERFKRDSVLYAVLNGVNGMAGVTADQVQILTCDVKEAHEKLKREFLRLRKFARVFNTLFTTDSNRCFDTAERLFGKIRSSISGVKLIYKKTCATIRRRYPGYGKKKASVFDHSPLATGFYCADLFGEESYPEVVRELCDAMEAFFSDLVRALKLCREVIKLEAAIRNNPKRLADLYEADYQGTKIQQQAFIEYAENAGVPLEQDWFTKYKQTHSLQNFLSKMFHQYNRHAFKMHVVNEAIAQGRAQGLEAEEAVMWKNCQEQVPRMRLVIEHFDELNLKGRKDKASGKYKISGVAMAHLVKWCMLEGTGKEREFVDCYFPKHYRGDCLPVKSNTVNNAKNHGTASGQGSYENFTSKVEALLNRYAESRPVRRAPMQGQNLRVASSY